MLIVLNHTLQNKEVISVAKSFFKKSDAGTSTPDSGKPDGEFITWGAGWLGELKGSDLPFLSVRVSKEELARIVAHAESTESGDVAFMMFPNRNPREGKKDPDYYLFPPREAKD